MELTADGRRAALASMRRHRIVERFLADMLGYAWNEADRLATSFETETPQEVEDRIFGTLFDVFGHRKHDASSLHPIKPTVAEILSDPTNLTFRLPSYDPDFPVYDFADIIDCDEQSPELEALDRRAKVLPTQYPW